MTQIIIDLGTGPNTKDGDPVRVAFDKVNQNFTEVYDSLAILGGNTTPGATVDVSIKGSVYGIDSTLIVDATTGKITTSAVPNTVPLMYSFRANFLSNGNLNSLQDLPAGWNYTKSGNVVTITHTLDRDPNFISYWGYTAAEGMRLRFPTAGYQATYQTGIIKLNLNSAVTGADNSQYAKVTVLF